MNTSGEVWRAPAKINLGLDVLGVRPDGHHAIDTVLQTIDLFDTVTLERGAAPGISIRVTGSASEGVPEDDTNLAVRAATVLAERTGHAPELAIGLEKEIPAGAGLGGGSSDAAAVLLALARRFAVPDPTRTLVDLAAELGADVPFFLEGGTRRATGKGDRLERAEPPAERWGVLVVPPVVVSTAAAYAWWDEASGSRAAPTASDPPIERREWRSAGNDLEAVVVPRRPEIGRVIELLADGPAAVARMTGTGSGVFAVYDSAETRDRDLPRIRGGIAAAAPDSRVEPFACTDRGVAQAPARAPQAPSSGFEKSATPGSSTSSNSE